MEFAAWSLAQNSESKVFLNGIFQFLTCLLVYISQDNYNNIDVYISLDYCKQQSFKAADSNLISS